MSEQLDLSALLREASELMGEASDKLTAASLLEQERGAEACRTLASFMGDFARRNG